jgi:hypothetical protein
MGPRITVGFATPDEFIRSYRLAGITFAIVVSLFTMILALSNPDVVMPGAYYIGAIPISYVIAWFTVHTTWSTNDELQRKADKAFNNAYFHTFPMAYGVSAVVSALCMGFDLV